MLPRGSEVHVNTAGDAGVQHVAREDAITATVIIVFVILTFPFTGGTLHAIVELRLFNFGVTLDTVFLHIIQRVFRL